MATISKYVGKRGTTWRAQVRRKGFPSQTDSFESKADAKRWATEIENQMDKRKFVPLGDAENTSLYEALERYLIEVTPTKKGAKQETARIRQLRSMALSEFALTALRSADIASWRDALLKENKAPTTIRNLATIVSQVYETARQEWGMEGLSNPVRGVRMPKHRLGRDRRLVANADDKKDEEKRLLVASKNVSCIYLTPIIIIALETGMRLGEILSIQRKHIDFNECVAHLPDTKNNTSRNVPLSSRALKAIKDTPANLSEARIFPIKKDAGQAVDTIEYHFRKAREAAKLKDFRFHDLRHEATSRLFEMGLDIMEVSAITGHKTLDMLKRYTHLKAADLAKKLG